MVTKKESPALAQSALWGEETDTDEGEEEFFIVMSCKHTSTEETGMAL